MHGATGQESFVEPVDEFRHLFEDVARTLPGAIFRYVLYPDGRDDVVYKSPGCFDIWEISEEALKDGPSPIWALIDPEDMPRMQKSVEESAKRLEPWDLHYHITTPSGKRKYLHGRGQPTRRSDGAIVWTSLIIDVTSKEVAEAEINRSMAMYGEIQKQEELTRYSRGIGHDFKKLLTVIIGNAELLGDLGLDPSSRDLIAEVLDAARRSEMLVQRLSRMATAPAGIGEAVDVNCAVRSMNSLLERALPDSVSFAIKLTPDLPDVVVNPGLLDSAILNLVLNARDAMPQGGQLQLSTGLARVSCASDATALDMGQYVVVSVEDTENGIRPGQFEELLRPYMTTQSSTTGAGLGLALVDSFARASGGAVQIGRDKGSGAQLNLLLPVSLT